jgi:hypothetical protein
MLLTSLKFTETSTFVTSRKNCRQDFREQFHFRFVSTLLASRGGQWASENPNHTTAKSEVSSLYCSMTSRNKFIIQEEERLVLRLLQKILWKDREKQSETTLKERKG